MIKISRTVLEKLIRENKSTDFIAKKFNCEVRTIERRINNYGLLGIRRNTFWKLPNDGKKLCYLAGIIDGEGTITINSWCKKSCVGTPRIMVTNTDERLIDWLIKNFGGRKYYRERKNHRWKGSYKWWLCGVMSTELCKKILPFLIIKKKQAELLINFYTERRLRERRENGTWKQLTEEERNRRRKIGEEILRLNKRGRGD